MIKNYSSYRLLKILEFVDFNNDQYLTDFIRNNFEEQHKETFEFIERNILNAFEEQGYEIILSELELDGLQSIKGRIVFEHQNLIFYLAIKDVYNMSLYDCTEVPIEKIKKDLYYFDMEYSIKTKSLSARYISSIYKFKDIVRLVNNYIKHKDIEIIL